MISLPKQLVVIGDSSVYGWGDNEGGGWCERLRKEGLLKVNRVRSITGVGIKRSKNAKIFIKILELLLLKIPITNGGKLIAIPVDKRLKIIVSNISFNKSNNPKSELDLKRELKELKLSKLFLKIK